MIGRVQKVNVLCPKPHVNNTQIIIIKLNGRQFILSIKNFGILKLCIFFTLKTKEDLNQSQASMVITFYHSLISVFAILFLYILAVTKVCFNFQTFLNFWHFR